MQNLATPISSFTYTRCSIVALKDILPSVRIILEWPLYEIGYFVILGLSQRW